jgi:hypothetical protein
MLSSKEPNIEYCNNVLYIMRYQSRDVIYPVLKSGTFLCGEAPHLETDNIFFWMF